MQSQPRQVTAEMFYISLASYWIMVYQYDHVQGSVLEQLSYNLHSACSSKVQWGDCQAEQSVTVVKWKYRNLV